MATVIREAIAVVGGRRTLGQKASVVSSAKPQPEADSSDIPCSNRSDESPDSDKACFQELTTQCEELTARLAQVSSQLESLQTESDAQWKVACDEGRAAGREEGLREIATTEISKLQMLDTVADALKVHQEKLFDTVESLVVELGFAAVAKICGRAAIDTELLAHIIHQAIAQLREEARVKIRLPPSDVKRMQEYRDSGGSVLNWAHIDLIADVGLDPGTCAVSGRSGTLQAGLDLQLRNLKELLRATHDQSEGGRGP